jgi:thiamine biosynthesis lipoprotein
MRDPWWWYPSILLLVATGCGDPSHLQERWSVMGREAAVDLYGATDADVKRQLEEIRKAFAEVASKMGDPHSGELGSLNDGAADEYFEVEDHDLFRTVVLALDYARASRGAFDPTVAPLVQLYARGAGRLPSDAELQVTLESVGWQRVAVAYEARAIKFRRPRMAFDLGGVAPGFALDAGARAFARPGSIGGVLRVGHNLYAWGRPPDAEEWTVAIPDPRLHGRELFNLRTSNRGISVTGHSDIDPTRLLDPSTGRPAAGDLLAAVALADSGADADVLSTAMFVAGSARSGDLLTKTRRVEAVLLVGASGSRYLLASASLEGRIELSPELLAETGGQVRYILPPQGL